MNNTVQKRFIRCFVILGLSAALTSGFTACLAKAPAPRLIAITVAPSTPANLAVGAMTQFTATGTYADGSTADITNKVTWNSDSSMISIDSWGIATGVTAGTADVTAVLAGISTPPVALTITPIINPTTGVYGNYYLGLVRTMPTVKRSAATQVRRHRRFYRAD